MVWKLAEVWLRCRQGVWTCSNVRGSPARSRISSCPTLLSNVLCPQLPLDLAVGGPESTVERGGEDRALAPGFLPTSNGPAVATFPCSGCSSGGGGTLSFSSTTDCVLSTAASPLKLREPLLDPRELHLP